MSWPLPWRRPEVGDDRRQRGRLDSSRAEGGARADLPTDRRQRAAAVRPSRLVRRSRRGGRGGHLLGQAAATHRRRVDASVRLGGRGSRGACGERRCRDRPRRRGRGSCAWDRAGVRAVRADPRRSAGGLPAPTRRRHRRPRRRAQGARGGGGRRGGRYPLPDVRRESRPPRIQAATARSRGHDPHRAVRCELACAAPRREQRGNGTVAARRPTRTAAESDAKSPARARCPPCPRFAPGAHGPRPASGEPASHPGGTDGRRSAGAARRRPLDAGETVSRIVDVRPAADLVRALTP